MKSSHFGTMRTYPLPQLVLLAVFFVFVPVTHAKIITFNFEGELTKIDTPLQGAFSVGDSFSGSYTFDSDVPPTFNFSAAGESSGSYHDSISAMSFSSGNYTAMATHGVIGQDFQDEPGYGVGFQSIFGSPVGAFVPRSLGMDWVLSLDLLPSGRTTTIPFGPTIVPAYDPNLPPFDISTLLDYFDADGNLIYNPSRGLLGNPDQPLFLNDGSPAPTNGDFSFSFLSADGQRVSVLGKLSSVTAIEEGLVAHWPLDDGSGELAEDISGKGHDGVLTRGPVWSGNGLLFDGVDDYVNVGVFEVIGNDLTLAAWAQSDHLKNCGTSDCRIISKSTGTAEQDHIWMLSTIKVGSQVRLRFRLRAGDGRTSTLIASSGDLMDGELFHAAATYDGTTMRIYKNGVEVGSRAKTLSITNNRFESGWIGGNPNAATSRPWKGLISDVRIYKKALTEEELEAVMEDRP